ncbi:MAG: hypothetical protein MHM6MM_003224 [Cercozoa sp. M6MM]
MSDFDSLLRLYARKRPRGEVEPSEVAYSESEEEGEGEVAINEAGVKEDGEKHEEDEEDKDEEDEDEEDEEDRDEDDITVNGDEDVVHLPFKDGQVTDAEVSQLMSLDRLSFALLSPDKQELASEVHKLKDEDQMSTLMQWSDPLGRTELPSLKTQVSTPRRLLLQWRAAHKKELSKTRRKRRKLGLVTEEPDSENALTSSDLPHHVQRVCMPLLGSTYADLHMPCRQLKHASALRRVCALHALRICLFSQQQVARNTRKIKRWHRRANELRSEIKEQQLKLLNEKKLSKKKRKEAIRDIDRDIEIKVYEKFGDEPDLRDQGFTRAKVLFVVPFRSQAREVVDTLLQLLPESATAVVHNRKRLQDEFDLEPTPSFLKRSSDYQQVFGPNADDAFQVGIKIGKKQVRLFANLRNSDIIVASPLGLRTIIGHEMEDERDIDFLSSVELLVMDSVDTLEMQNPEHLNTLLSALNKQPFHLQDTDFARVRQWQLAGDNDRRVHRQTVWLSRYDSPLQRRLRAQYCRNFRGTVLLRQTYKGVLHRCIPQVRYLAMRAPRGELSKAHEMRYDFFLRECWPRVALTKHTVVVVPDYCDFVRLRSHLSSEKSNAVFVSEYADQSTVSRAQQFLSSGQRDVVFVTERAHFFRRNNWRGMRHLVFYAPPAAPTTFLQLVNQIASASQDVADEAFVMLCFDRFQRAEMQRIVGCTRARTLMLAAKDTHTFC